MSAAETPNPVTLTPAPGVARGYSWPPFEPGNLAAKTHGAWSDRLVDPLAQEIIAEMTPVVTWWTPADMPTVAAWARTEARIQLITSWLGEQGGDLHDREVPLGASGHTLTELGAVQPAAQHLSKLEARAESLRSKLGLDPLSRARLGKDVAGAQVDMARLMADEAARRAEGADDGDR